MRRLAILALFTVTVAIPMLGGRPKEGFTSHLLLSREMDPSLLASHRNSGSKNLTQKLDHFDAKNTKTWLQQYFYNYEYTNDDSRVNLLYLSGEQSASLSMVINDDNSYVYYGMRMNASLYALEHRFYGESRPTEDTSIDNLKFLSSRQAIEDIAEFIRQKNEEKGGEQKWIVVGGSYAGALSAWARLKHPELISGSLASSAPILAQMDFYGYLQTVDEDFKKVGGLCYKQIGEGLEEARRLFQSEEGRQKLSALFRLRPHLSSFDQITDYDIDTFFKYLIQPFFSTAQNNFYSVEEACNMFTTHGADYDPLKALKNINICDSMNINFTQSVVELSVEGYAEQSDMSQRLWTYQTCAEFGYFHTTNRGSNVFGQTQSSNTLIEYCMQLFGIDADQIQKNVDSVNEFYGGRDYYAGTNVIFSHGTQDPWSFLTKKSDPKHWSVVIVEIEGGWHVSDLGLSCTVSVDYCSDNMKQVQILTLENMQRWVDPIFPVPDRVEISDNVGKRPQLYDPTVSPSLLTNRNYPDSVNQRGNRSTEAAKISKNADNKKRSKFVRRSRDIQPPRTVSNSIEETDTIGWIEQTWDHFNPNEERTFKQKFFYNYKFGSIDGPNFLMIGGEGVFNTYYWVTIENLAWMTYAKTVGANVFLLEHRYYGESKLGTNDLQYLTSSQMIYDVATFIRTQQVKQNRTGPWITFGGSYPGALSIWSREWFPELIVGAVGSSVPVLAKNDFYEYLEVVEDVIKRQSQKCYDRTAEAFETLHKLAQDPEGRATIQEKFVLSPEWTSDANETIDALDINNVFYYLYGMYQDPVQSNSVDWSDVTELCSYFDSDEFDDSLDALSALRMDIYKDKPISSSFDFDLQYFIRMKDHIDGHDETYNDDELAGILWLWQTCNEFGYYQTTDYGEGIFGTPVPLNFFIIVCERVFGVRMDHVENGVARTNYQYGGRNRFNTTNVVLPNGNVDPWHALGILEQGNLDESVVPILINGTSHVADMFWATESDPPQLTQARKTILENIQKWIIPSQSPPTEATKITREQTNPTSVQTMRTTSITPSPTTSLDSSFTSVIPAIVLLFFSLIL